MSSSARLAAINVPLHVVNAVMGRLVEANRLSTENLRLRAEVESCRRRRRICSSSEDEGGGKEVSAPGRKRRTIAKSGNLRNPWPRSDMQELGALIRDEVQSWTHRQASLRSLSMASLLVAKNPEASVFLRHGEQAVQKKLRGALDSLGKEAADELKLLHNNLPFEPPPLLSAHPCSTPSSASSPPPHRLPSPTSSPVHRSIVRRSPFLAPG
ncbi:hypothetical protein PENTCL1PPCAC_24978, partial [Pristionchus entomophagus]